MLIAAAAISLLASAAMTTTLPGQAANAATTTVPAKACAKIVAAVNTSATKHNSTAAVRANLLGAAQVLCHAPTVGSLNLKAVRVTATAVTVKAASTIAPDPTCVADVASEIPAALLSSYVVDAKTAEDDLCTTQAMTTTTAQATPGAPGSSAGDPANLPAGFPAKGVAIYQVTASSELCGVSCVIWYQKISELYFIQYGHWAWHGLKGYNWSYIDCNRNGGTGFSVTVNSCGWRGPNPGYVDQPIEALCEFEVSLAFHGFPISHDHSIGLQDWVDGAIDVPYN